MRSLSSSRTLMTLPDIMQRAETNRKSGTLTRKHDSTIKIFYVQEGKIVFISSQKAGEQLGDFFSNEGGIDLVQVPTGFWESQRLGVPFTGYLISHCIIGKIALQKADPDACRNGIYGGIDLHDRTFEFNDSLSAMIVNGPAEISYSFVLCQTVNQMDESLRTQQ